MNRQMLEIALAMDPELRTAIRKLNIDSVRLAKFYGYPREWFELIVEIECNLGL